jgi:hypothetical protein
MFRLMAGNSMSVAVAMLVVQEDNLAEHMMAVAMVVVVVADIQVLPGPTQVLMDQAVVVPADTAAMEETVVETKMALPAMVLEFMLQLLLAAVVVVVAGKVNH